MTASVIGNKIPPFYSTIINADRQGFRCSDRCFNLLCISVKLNKMEVDYEGIGFYADWK